MLGPPLLREANARGEALGLSEDELAFCDALETNDSAVTALGDEALRKIALELFDSASAFSFGSGILLHCLRWISRKGVIGR